MYCKDLTEVWMPVSRARNLTKVTLNQFELGSCQGWKSPTTVIIGRDIGTLTMTNDDVPLESSSPRRYWILEMYRHERIGDLLFKLIE